MQVRSARISGRPFCQVRGAAVREWHDNTPYETGWFLKGNVQDLIPGIPTSRKVELCQDGGPCYAFHSAFPDIPLHRTSPCTAPWQTCTYRESDSRGKIVTRHFRICAIDCQANNRTLSSRRFVWQSTQTPMIFIYHGQSVCWLVS